MAPPVSREVQGVVEGDPTNQSEAVVDLAIEEGRIATSERADWLTAIRTVGLQAVKVALAGRDPDPLRASGAKTLLQHAELENFARGRGLRVEELI